MSSLIFHFVGQPHQFIFNSHVTFALVFQYNVRSVKESKRVRFLIAYVPFGFDIHQLKRDDALYFNNDIQCKHGIGL